MPRSTQCGTYAGYGRHQRIGDTPCDQCRRAAAAYMREYRKTNKSKTNKSVVTEETLIYRRAYQRAKTDLLNRHPAEFRELVAKHVAAQSGTS